MFPCNDLFLTLRLWACSSELRLYSEAACQDGRLSRGCLSTTPPRDQRLLLFHVGSSLWPTAHYSLRRVFFFFFVFFLIFFFLFYLAFFYFFYHSRKLCGSPFYGDFFHWMVVKAPVAAVMVRPVAARCRHGAL